MVSDTDEKPEAVPIYSAKAIEDAKPDEVLSGFNIVDGFAMGQQFERAGWLAKEQGDQARFDVLGFLYSLCNIHWTPEDRGRVWGPMFVMADRRSMQPSDLSDAQNDALQDALPSIGYAPLRARVADIVWSNDRRRVIAGAIAMEAYCQCVDAQIVGQLVAQFQPDIIPSREAVRMTMRALQIAYATTKKNSPLPNRVTDTFAAMYAAARSNAQFVQFSEAAELGLYYRLLDRRQTAQDAEAVARTSNGQFPFVVRKVWDLAAHLYDILNDQDARRRCQLAAIDEILLMRKQVSGAGAEAAWVAEALQALSHVKDADELEQKLEVELRRLQRASVREMKQIPVELDLTAYGEATEKAFAGLSLSEGLMQFALLTNSPDVAELRKQALESLKSGPLLAMMTAVHVDDEGKIITKSPGAPTAGEPNEDWYTRQIDRFEQLRRVHVVGGGIEPARLVLSSRFTIAERHVYAIVACSGFPPESQRSIFALGITRFFQGDFISAAHLLVPQIEPSLRHLLRMNGAFPVKAFPDGTEEDMDLGNMLDRKRQELDKIFSPNVVAELERIFHVRPGPAFRHEVAHGLLTGGECYGPNVIYALWFIYRLCVLFAFDNWPGVIAPAIDGVDPPVHTAS